MSAFILGTCLAFAGPGMADGDTRPAQPPLFSVAHKFQLHRAQQSFHEVRELILSRYYSSAITNDILYQSAIEGMLRQISPPSTPELAKLWSAEQYDQIVKSLTGVSTSAGFKSRFNLADGSLTVTEVDENSPAHGRLRLHDRIMRIGGQRLLGENVAKINTWLRGKPGDTIDLTVVRDIKVLQFAIEFKPYETQNLSLAELPKNVAYMRLAKVTLDSSKEMREALRGFADKGIKRVVVDLRDNSGGVFLEGLRLAELFLASKSVLGRTVKNGSEVKSYVSGNDTPFDFHVALLVGKKTASAAEIFAAAMQTHKAATLVGNVTFGKATMEQTFPLESGDRVKFIIGALYDPRGRTWHEQGLKPDFLATDDEKQRESWRRLGPTQRLRRDTALLTAYKLLLRAPRAEKF